MMKTKSNTVESKVLRGESSSSILIEAGSFVIDNQWVSYNNYWFKVDDYIKSVIGPNRQSFFSDRNMAIALVITLDIIDGIKIVEGKEVIFKSNDTVPYPGSLECIPLAGLILKQDGSTDLTKGYLSVGQGNLIKFSGTGNISEKNLRGATGLSNRSTGLEGLTGYRGIQGIPGYTGCQGCTGQVGAQGKLVRGEKGLRGMTGISWDVHLPFSNYLV